MLNDDFKVFSDVQVPIKGWQMYDKFAFIIGEGLIKPRRSAPGLSVIII